MTPRRGILIAALIAVGILFIWRHCDPPVTLRVHKVCFGKTRAEVIAIMGMPTKQSDYWCIFGPMHFSLRIREVIFPSRGLRDLTGWYPVAIRFDLEGRVDGIVCHSEGIRIYR